MVINFSVQDLHLAMQDPAKIRNLSVIAHVDHGKSTLTDSLFAGAGAMNFEQAGKRLLTDQLDDEAERGITIKSTGVSLLFPQNGLITEDTVINLIDSPGHVDFSSEVTAALRATDGAFVVVDCVEGVCVQTATVLRQALQDRIKPVVIINKLDRLFLELQCNEEEIYVRLRKVLESVNVIMSTYQDQFLGDCTVNPLDGTVAFAAGLMGWAFTLPQFAAMYAEKLHVDPQVILKNLWGDRFVNKSGEKWKWSRTASSPDWIRGFCEFILKPIKTIFDVIRAPELDWAKLDNMISKINVTLTSEQRDKLKDKHLIKAVLQQWIPAHVALVSMAIHHLPSPLKAQKYRVEHIYTGPKDDETYQAIQRCDPNGPLVVFISKMAPERPNDPNTRYLAFGRIFSGTVRAGQQVRVLGPNYRFGEKAGLYTNVPIQRCCVLKPKLTSLDSVPCGNTVGLIGFDKYIVKTATITTDPDSHPFQNMSFAVSAVVQQTVEPVSPTDIPKLIQAMKQLSTSDSLVRCFTSPTGEYIIAGAGELHMEICINDLQRSMGDAKLIVKDPTVTYCETVVSESSIIGMSKAPNRHSKLYGKAQPADAAIIHAVDEGTLSFDQGITNVTKQLREKFNWKMNEVANVWSFAPLSEGSPTNMVVNTSSGVQYLNEAKPHIIAALETVCQAGPLADEPIRGVRFDIVDAVLHSDSIHRGPGQMIPCGLNFFKGVMLTSSPRFMEPVYLVEISCPQEQLSGCYNTLCKRRGTVFDEIPQEGTNLVVLQAYLPVAESFGFTGLLRAATKGQAFPQMVFHHWDLVDGDPLQEGTRANAIMKQIRKRKGLPDKTPCSTDYLDKV